MVVDGVVVFFFVFEGVCVDIVVVWVYYVVIFEVEIWGWVWGNFEGFVVVCGSDDGVGWGNGWDDVFDGVLGERVGYVGDIIFFCVGESFLVELCDVCWVVFVEFWEGFFLVLGDDVGLFDVVFGLVRDGCDGVEWNGSLRCVYIELVFDVRGYRGEDDFCLVFEVFCVVVDERFDVVWVIFCVFCDGD